VQNVAPSIGILSAVQGPPSGCTIPAVTLTVPFTDPGIGDDPFNVHVAWGDGSQEDFPVSGSSGTYSLQVNHTYSSTGNKAISVIVADDELAQDADSTNITVNGSAGGPATVAIAGAPVSSPEGTSIGLTSSVQQSCASPINYAWSVTKNGNPFATGSAAKSRR
jgi:hypothetical protein